MVSSDCGKRTGVLLRTRLPSYSPKSRGVWRGIARSVAAIVVCAAAPCGRCAGISAPGEPAAESLEGLVRQYVNLRTQAAQLQVAWREQKAVLESELAMLSRQVAAWKKDLADQRARNAALERDTRAAESRRATYERALKSLEKQTADMEQWLHSFIASLPAPLQSRIRAAAGRNAASLVESDIGERLAVLLKMLEALATVDQEVIHARMMLPGPDGARQEVQALFFGLGAGYALSSDGRLGAAAEITPRGWTWKWRADLAEPVREAIERHTRERPPGFVRLPVRIRTNVDRPGTSAGGAEERGSK